MGFELQGPGLTTRVEINIATGAFENIQATNVKYLSNKSLVIERN